MNNRTYQLLYCSIAIIALGTGHMSLRGCADDALFYRAPRFFGEPRLTRKNLTSLEFDVTSGSTRQSRNCAGEKTCLLNIYGPQNMLVLGAGVPNKNPSNPADLALINLAMIPPSDDFAQLLFKGKFHITQFDITATQNLAQGFFLAAHVPYRSLEISCTDYIDLSPQSPECSGCPDVNTPQWQTFLNLFPTILQQYNLNIGSVDKHGIGDVTVQAGWSYSYHNPQIDFFDVTLAAGVIIPTGLKKRENIVFDLPLGYNGFTGGSLAFDCSVGFFDWITMGGHVGGRFFNTIRKNLRLKTDINQNGFIKLAHGCVCIHHGPIFDIGVFAKADHIIRGFSFLIGYSFIHQKSYQLIPENDSIFNAAIINSDAVYQGWKMDTLHILFEYDFADEERAFGPRIGVVYNKIIGGERIFNTSLGGGYLGFDIAWDLI